MLFNNVLKNVYYKAYVGEKPEDIWIDVANYIEENYKEEKIEKVFIAYILNNWEGIEIYNEDEDVIGCSAEGHISHVFSVRLSRNPLGWSREGLKLMAKLRVFNKNGGDLREVEWGKKKNINEGSYKLTKKQIKEAVRRVKTSTNEKINNITVLNIGKVTPMYRILRAIKYAQVI